MKECIADERSACQDRVDRQAFKDKVEWSQRQQVRDGALRHEISGWLEVISGWRNGDISCSSPSVIYRPSSLIWRRVKRNLIIRKLLLGS